MHPAVKGVLLVYQAVKALDELSEGKLRREGKKLIKHITEKKVTR